MFRKTLIMYCLPLFFILLYASGGCNPTKVRVCKVVLAPAVKDSSGFPQTRFAFVISANYNEFCTAALTGAFISSCYAFKKCSALQNDVDTTSFRLSFDRAVWTGIDTLQPGTDIMTHPVFKKYAPVSGGGFVCSALRYFIGNTDTTVVKELMFEAGTYTVFLSCRTTDSVRLESVATATFR